MDVDFGAFLFRKHIENYQVEQKSLLGWSVQNIPPDTAGTEQSNIL